MNSNSYWSVLNGSKKNTKKGFPFLCYICIIASIKLGTTGGGGCLNHMLCELHKTNTANDSRTQCRNIVLQLEDRTTGEWKGKNACD